MFYVLIYIWSLMKDVYVRHRDPRTQHMPLVGSPLPITIVISVYLLFVLHYGPKWMDKRKPFDLKYIMRIYNAIQVIANVYLFYYGFQNSYLRKEFSLTCQPVLFANTEPWMMRLLYATYGYYLTKFLDLFDTVFIVLRKKNNQITFLHVYHHAGMVFGVYVFMTFLAGSHSTMLGVINLFIHAVMYSYYFCSSVKPVTETLWWKRHITELQLLQFGYLIIHFFLAIVAKDCTHPMVVAFVGLIQNLFMFVLFFDFYYKAYVKKKLKTNGSVKANKISAELELNENKLKSS